jgi:hypothetical protein
MTTVLNVSTNTQQTVAVGDDVSFKSDIEQSGRVVRIDGNYLVLENAHGFSGDYLRGATRTREHRSDCWID